MILCFNLSNLLNVIIIQLSYLYVFVCRDKIREEKPHFAARRERSTALSEFDSQSIREIEAVSKVPRRKCRQVL